MIVLFGFLSVYGIAASPSLGIYTRTFNNGDSHSLNLQKPGPDSYIAYFGIKSHFFYGRISFTITNSTGIFTLYPHAGDRFWLADCEVDIEYLNAWSPCQITIFVISPDTCHYTIHARNQKSATISTPFSEFPYNRTICYFLEFRRNPHISFSGLSAPDWASIYYPLGNGTVKLLQVNKTELDMHHLFLLVLKKSTANPLKISFGTTSVSSDWTEVDGPFVDLDDLSKSQVIESFGLVTDRVLPWWLWALLLGGMAGCLLIFGFVLFWHSPTLGVTTGTLSVLDSAFHPPSDMI
jgi:hypothetical protein